MNPSRKSKKNEPELAILDRWLGRLCRALDISIPPRSNASGTPLGRSASPSGFTSSRRAEDSENTLREVFLASKEVHCRLFNALNRCPESCRIAVSAVVDRRILGAGGKVKYYVIYLASITDQNVSRRLHDTDTTLAAKENISKSKTSFVSRDEIHC